MSEQKLIIRNRIASIDYVVWEMQQLIPYNRMQQTRIKEL